MKTERRWKWKMLSDTIPGKIITSPIYLSETEALRRDPNAKKIEHLWEDFTFCPEGEGSPGNTGL